MARSRVEQHLTDAYTQSMQALLPFGCAAPQVLSKAAWHLAFALTGGLVTVEQNPAASAVLHPDLVSGTTHFRTHWSQSDVDAGPFNFPHAVSSSVVQLGDGAVVPLPIMLGSRRRASTTGGRRDIFVAAILQARVDAAGSILIPRNSYCTSQRTFHDFFLFYCLGTR